VDAADAAYALFKNGQASGLKILNGKVVKISWTYKLKTLLQNLNVGQRLFGIIVLAVITAAMLTGYGVYGLSATMDSFKTVYEDRMVSTRDIGEITKRMLENRTLLRTALSEVSIDNAGKEPIQVMNREIAAKSAENIEKNIEVIGDLWKAYMGNNNLTPEEKVLADKFSESRGKFVKEALKPALASLRANHYEETKRLAVVARELYATASVDVDALGKLQFDVANNEYKAGVARFENTRLFSFSALGVAIAILIWMGLFVLRTITRPLESTIDTFGKIASGNLNTAIDIEGNDELSQVLRALKIMQTMFSSNVNEQQEMAIIGKEQSTLFENQLAAISKSTGVIEFNMDGTVITANDILLKVLGYSLSEAVGKHHSAFVDAAYRNSPEYKAFWAKLNRGEAITGKFKRIDKQGKEVWLEASYNPIADVSGVAYKVVKYATDITELNMKNADYEGQIEAIGKSQGVIEIALDGTVIKANTIYLQMLGYAENELIGKHVSIVLDPTFAKSADYTTLWNKLVAGGSDAGQYKRIAKNGKEVWIQASYNPIFDLNGKAYKIVNYTIDITAQKLQAADNAGQLAAIDKIQGVIEFDLNGKILAVNTNFASATGYSEKEIVGNHHSMFVEPTYRTSHEYKAFWDKLARGEADSGQYKRIAKGNKEIWLQASYNPIMDINGKPFKVVKYATDITEQHQNAAALTEAVEETQGIIEGAKEGDLSSRVSLNGKTGAIASLCDGVNALMDQMTEVIIQVREAGETINTAAGEIASGNNDLSQRTEQQASSLEETASSMEELASTVKQNAENAKQANQLAAAASSVAVKGGEVVGQVVGTMSAINQSAKKIEDIISVIDGIAFQTNILALNAAVEAARAGEQGRGFAVVAGEVRNLAQRSATAAKEIKELIADSVSKTAEGTVQVENAGRTMQEIVSSVQRVTDIMGEISAASSEQSAGIDQVNNAITSMDEVTQQNAALVEEAAAAAESLVEQAVSLIETVSAFQLSGNQSQSANASASRQPSRVSKPTLKVVASTSARSPSRGSSTKVTTSAKLGAKDSSSNGDWEEF
jgi:methyl-accepting chemotaxis protein